MRAPLRDCHPTPGLVSLNRDLVLAPFPPGFRSPAAPLPATAFCYLPPSSEGVPAQALPPWWPRLTGRRVVHATLGSEFGLESGDLFDRLIAGLSQLDAELVVTVGRDLDPAEFEAGSLPPHIHVEQWVPLQNLLPHCDLVVSHGGSGTVLAALRHGVPQLAVPMGADQLHNADRIVTLGLGSFLDAVRSTPADIREAAATALLSTAIRANCTHHQREFQGLPSIDAAADELEQLSASRRSG